MIQTKIRKMKAAVIAAPGEAVIENNPLPEPKEYQARIRLQGCGVCRSSLPLWQGRPWFRYPFPPGQPGHEGWGIVDAVGTGVERLRPGDRVALLSYHAFAQYDLAREDETLRLPPELAEKPFPGEALGCAVNVFKRSGVNRGETVAVVGAGFLGLAVIALSVKAGARVIALSRREFSLEIAREFGAAHTVKIEDHCRAIQQVKEVAGESGCDCVIEAAGEQWPLDLAAELTRERGRLVIAGYHQDPRQVNMQLWNWRGLDVINAHERDPRIYLQGMAEAARLFAEGSIDFSLLFTHALNLEQLPLAFKLMTERPAGFLKAWICYDE
jgi:threonine dehydrogenase-like Zn-dependent dehydrogenase